MKVLYIIIIFQITALFVCDDFLQPWKTVCAVWFVFRCAFLICLFVETREKKFSLFGVGCVKISSKSYFFLLVECTLCLSGGSQWTFFFFNVAQCMSCGQQCGVCLVLFGLCHRVLDLLAAWQGTFGRNGNIAFWRAVSHCITWCLRREQNARCFEGCEWSIIEIQSLFFCTLLDWSLAFKPFPCPNFLDMLEHCNLKD